MLYSFLFYKVLFNTFVFSMNIFFLIFFNSRIPRVLPLPQLSR